MLQQKLRSFRSPFVIAALTVLRPPHQPPSASVPVLRGAGGRLGKLGLSAKHVSAAHQSQEEGALPWTPGVSAAAGLGFETLVLWCGDSLEDCH